MKNNFARIAENYKKNLEIRLENDNEEKIKPAFSATNTDYEISDKIKAISCGGIGLVDKLIKKTGLPEMINKNFDLLKRHKPYFESDHILNIAYNIICGGICLEDLELLRNNVSYMDALGAKRIPDPTTAGDFLRRFKEDDIRKLMDVFNEANTIVWENTLDEQSRRACILDVDGKIQSTYGECKEGMDMSYTGEWGFSTLAITEATTGAHLHVVNRSGNALSQEGADEWIDKSIETVKKTFDSVYLRGDSAFSLTWKLDEWNDQKVKFIFGYDAFSNLVKKADLLGKSEWKPFSKPKKKREKKRKKKPRVKEAAVIRREYKNIIQKKLYVSEFKYRPGKCKKDYRVIVLKKIMDVKKGQQLLFEDVRYFFYITNIYDMSPTDLVKFIHGRCNHENKIEQLDNGIHALKMPAAEFMANWAYMVICSLAWNIKSWLGLLMVDNVKGEELIRAEFKSFQNKIIQIPCQVLTTGRKIIFRYLNYNSWVESSYATFIKIKKIRFSSA